MAYKNRKKSRAYIRRRRRMRMMILVLFVVFIAVGFIVVNAMLSLPYESIDLSELATVEIGGYNTAGTAQVVVNDDAVDELLAAVKKDYNEAHFHSTDPNDEDYLKFRQSLAFNVDKTVGLSNGSVINLYCSYDKELADTLKIDITSTTKEITVGGLPTVTRLSVEQVFEGLSVSFTGVSPSLELTMTNESANPFVQGVGFEIVEPKEYYSEGETVAIRANYTDDLSVSTQYVVDCPQGECIKEYIASADSKYLASASELPQSIIDEAISAGKNAFKDANEYGVRIFCEANLVPIYIDKKATFVYGAPQFVSAYFKTVFPEKAGDINYDYNDLDIIYSVVISQADGVKCTAYAAVRFSNIIKNSDGTYEYDFSSPKILSESYFSARVKKNVTDSYANSHNVERVYQ